MRLNNPYISNILGAVVTPYKHSWQLDYRTPFSASVNDPSIVIVNTFLDIMEELGIKV